MRGVANFCDYFVICSVQNARQACAIADFIEDSLADLRQHLSRPKGSNDTSWIVFDSGDVVTHIFTKDVREFYNLEHLWQDARVVQWETRCKIG